MNSKYAFASPLQKVTAYSKLKAAGLASNTPKGNNTPRSKSSQNPQKLLQELEQQQGNGSASGEFFKIKCSVLTEQMSVVQEENDKLKKENENLRTFNFEYVKQLNELSASKLRAAEKIIITPEFFESDHINQKVKDFMRKLANNYKLLEKEQTKLIDHCRIMEVDIENYRKKVVEADQITEKLKQTGQNSIEQLVQSLQDTKSNQIQIKIIKTDDKVDQLTQQTKELGLELAIRNEKISNLEGTITDLNNEIVEHKDEYQKLLIKYNRTVSLNEEKKQFDHKQIYDYKLKVDHLEYELRQLQGTLMESNKQIIDYDIKIQDLYFENDNLSRMSQSGFSTNRKNLNGTTPSVTFK